MDIVKVVKYYKIGFTISTHVMLLCMCSPLLIEHECNYFQIIILEQMVPSSDHPSEHEV